MASTLSRTPLTDPPGAHGQQPGSAAVEDYTENLEDEAGHRRGGLSDEHVPVGIRGRAMTVPQSPYRRAAGGTVSGEMSTGCHGAAARRGAVRRRRRGVGGRARRQRHPRPVDADAPGARPGPGRAQGRGEIERTQADLSQDVDALTDKVTPSKIVERQVGPRSRLCGPNQGEGDGQRHRVDKPPPRFRTPPRRPPEPCRTPLPPPSAPRRRSRGRSDDRPGVTRWPPGSSRSAPASSCLVAAARQPPRGQESSPTKPRRSRRGRCNRSCSRWQWKSEENLREA